MSTGTAQWKQKPVDNGLGKSPWVVPGQMSCVSQRQAGLGEGSSDQKQISGLGVMRHFSQRALSRWNAAAWERSEFPVVGSMQEGGQKSPVREVSGRFLLLGGR